MVVQVDFFSIQTDTTLTGYLVADYTICTLHYQASFPPHTNIAQQAPFKENNIEISEHLNDNIAFPLICWLAQCS